MRRFYKVTVLVSMCCLTFAMTGCSKIREIVDSYEAPTEAVKTTNENQYKVVTSDEEIHKMILETMEANKTACYFNVADESMIKAEDWIKAFDGINDIQVEYTMTQSGYNVFLTLSYWDMYPIVAAFKNNDTTTLSAAQLELFDKYCDIIGTCVSKDKSPYENELAIHDYLVQNIQYDSTLKSSGAYDTITKGTAMCMGYTEVFKTLLDMIDIENKVVSGIANGEEHVWNMVKLDGEWYHVDVTWNDSGSSDDNIKYTFFNINDEDMALDHIWDKTLYPAATGIRYNYYNVGDITKINGQGELDKYIADCVAAQKERIGFVAYGEVDLNQAFQKTNVAMDVSFGGDKKAGFVVYDITVKYK